MSTKVAAAIRHLSQALELLGDEVQLPGCLVALPPSVDDPVTAQEVTDALVTHHLHPGSPAARVDMRRTLEQFLDARAERDRKARNPGG